MRDEPVSDGVAPDRERVARLYAAYNARDLDRLTDLVDEDVDWPGGAGRLHGRAAVRAFWSDQWARTRTHDEVVEVAALGSGRTAVRIDQVVRDPAGAVISRGVFVHTYEFKHGRVARMDLRELPRPKPGSETMEHETLLLNLYGCFNARDIPGALELLDAQVDWANGMDGGHVHGREAVRDYWTRQWAAIRPHVDPLRFTPRNGGGTAVEVHQVVRDLEGAVVLDETVRHVFRFEGGRVARFDIEDAGGLSALAHG